MAREFTMVQTTRTSTSSSCNPPKKKSVPRPEIALGANDRRYLNSPHFVCIIFNWSASQGLALDCNVCQIC